MKTISYASFFLLLSLTSCNNQDESNVKIQIESIATRIRAAESETTPIEIRIADLLYADSIAVKNQLHKEHLSCFRLLGTIFLQTGNPDSSIKYFIVARKLSLELSDSESLAIVYNNLGQSFSDLGKYDSAIEYFTSASEIFEQLNNKKWLAESKINIGIAFENQGSYEDALKVNIEAAHLLDSIGDKDALSSAYLNIGNIVNQVGRPVEARQYYNSALSILREINDSDGIAYIMNNVGYSHQCQKEFSQALQLYNGSLYIKQSRKSSPKVLAVTINNIAEAYYGLKKYDSSELYFLKARRLSTLCKDKDGYINSSNKLSKQYIETDKLEKAKAITLEANRICPSTGFLEQRLENNMLLFEIYRKEGNYKLASDFAVKAATIKDSIFSKAIGEAIIRMNTKYKVERKEKELAASRFIQQNQSIQIRLQKTIIFLMITFLLILSIVILLLVRSNKIIKSAKRRIDLLMKELSHRVKNNLMLITDMLYLQKKIATDTNQLSLIEASINRVQSMNIIHTLLYSREFNGTINILDFMSALINNLKHTFQSTNKLFDIEMRIESVQIDLNRAIPLGLITNELLTNIYKYSESIREKSSVKIDFHLENGYYVLQIEDDSKYWDINEAKKNKSGLGLYIVEALTQQINANWQTLNNTSGTIQKISFLRATLTPQNFKTQM